LYEPVFDLSKLQRTKQQIAFKLPELTSYLLLVVNYVSLPLLLLPTQVNSLSISEKPKDITSFLNHLHSELVG